MKEILQQFARNCDSIERLLEFDRLIIDIAIQALRSVHELLTSKGFGAWARRLDNRIAALEQIHKNDSLRSYYEAMINQCVVLLVSYFSTALEDAFKYYATRAIANGDIKRFEKEELSLTMKDLQECDFDLRDRVASLLASKDDVSFQDMKSVNRLFNRYFGYDHARDADLSNIIFGQAARHIIVHNSSLINERFTRQVHAATQRTIKPAFPNKGILRFDAAEIRALAGSMTVYLDAMHQQLK